VSSDDRRGLFSEAAADDSRKVRRDEVFRDGGGPLGLSASEEEETV
jgi:hypothetical protein